MCVSKQTNNFLREFSASCPVKHCNERNYSFAYINRLCYYYYKTQLQTFNVNAPLLLFSVSESLSYKCLHGLPPGISK